MGLMRPKCRDGIPPAKLYRYLRSAFISINLEKNIVDTKETYTNNLNIYFKNHLQILGNTAFFQNSNAKSNILLQFV